LIPLEEWCPHPTPHMRTPLFAVTPDDSLNRQLPIKPRS
jgi:hypothetical protein